MGLFNFDWHGQHEVDNIGMLVLWRDGGIMKNSFGLLI